MVASSKRNQTIVIERVTVVEDGYGGEAETWGTYAIRQAEVRFGTAQEKREAAQEGGVQSATFTCERSAVLDAVTSKDRIVYLGSVWDLIPPEPLDRRTIRFTGTRNA